MREYMQLVIAALSVAAASVLQAMGGADKIALALAVAMAVDYATGVACAAIWHRSPKSKGGALESRAGLKGLFRKGGIVLCCFLAAQLAQVMGTPAVRDSTMIFFVCNEALSIMENLGIMGVPFPPAIRRALEALKDAEDKDEPEKAPGYIDADYTEEK